MKMSTPLRLVTEAEPANDDQAITVRLERGHRAAEELLVRLEKGDGPAPVLLKDVRRELESHLRLTEQLMPLAHESDLVAAVAADLAARAALLEVLPANVTAPLFQARISQLCQLAELHFAHVEQQILSPLQRDRLRDGRAGTGHPARR